MQCSINLITRSPRCCVGIVLILDPPFAVCQSALGEHFHVDFVLVGPIANNLDLDRSGELPRLPLFENNLLIGLYVLRCKGLADPFPHRQIRLVSEPDRVVSDVSRVAVANLRSLSVDAGKAKESRSHQFHRLFRPRTADKCDEIVSPHSITSSAMASSDGG